MSTYRLTRSAYWYYGPKMADYIAEKYPDAVFIEELALKTKNGGYTSNPGIILYQENPPAPFTNKYFALYCKPDYDAIISGAPRKDQWVVTGLSTFDPVVEGVLVRDSRGGGTLAISRFAHDFFQFQGDAAVDGGRDYTRIVGSAVTTIVRIDLQKKKFELNGDWYDYE